MGWIATTLVMAVLVIGIAVRMTTLAPLANEWKVARRERAAHPDPARKRALMLALGGVLLFYVLVGSAFLIGLLLWGLEGGFLTGIAAFITAMSGLFARAVVSSAKNQ